MNYKFSMKMMTIILCFVAIMGCDKPNDLIRNIHICSLSSLNNAIDIIWQNSQRDDRIRWGYTAEFEQGIFKSQHKKNDIYYYVFPTLQPDRIVYYSILGTNATQWSPTYQFPTSSSSENQFDFYFGGDSRSDMNIWQSISSQIPSSAFFLFTGDNISDGSKMQLWNDWFAYGSNFLTRQLVFYTQGNHEAGQYYHDLFDSPADSGTAYYYFEYKNSIFICLDSESPSDITQLSFLENTLQNYQAKTWKFVFFHKPFFVAGSHSEDMLPYLDSWWTLFDQYGVDVIINGHDHNYMRSVPINVAATGSEPYEVAEYGSAPGQGRLQIVSGGMGAPIYGNHDQEWFVHTYYERHHYGKIQIFENQLILEAFDINSTMIDSVQINK